MKHVCAFLILLGLLTITSPVVLAQGYGAQVGEPEIPTTLLGPKFEVGEELVIEVKVTNVGTLPMDSLCWLVVVIRPNPADATDVWGFKESLDGMPVSAVWTINTEPPVKLNHLGTYRVTAAAYRDKTNNGVFTEDELISNVAEADFEVVVKKIDFWTPFMALALTSGVVGLVWAYSAKRWRVKA